MAKRSSTTSAASTTSHSFFEQLFERAAKEDRQKYSDGALEAAAKIAEKMIAGHKPARPAVDVSTGAQFIHSDNPLSIVTAVNDNSPFLLDSIMGCIYQLGKDVQLVVHPILDNPKDEDNRLSVIQVHIDALSAEQAEQLKSNIIHTLGHIKLAVNGWQDMRIRVDQAVHDLRTKPTDKKKGAYEEAAALLEWLHGDNFTFLGMREYDYIDGTLTRSSKKSLGLLADPEVRVLRRGSEAVTATSEIREFLDGSEPIIVTKANTKTTVHRQAYMDYIGVKRFDDNGTMIGELRIVGLFTSTAYTRSVHNIPYLRAKTQAVIKKMGFSPEDHSGKALTNVLESYPRDELFQIDLKTLTKNAQAILGLSERPRVRVLPRIDAFDRFVSVIVYVPRERYNSEVRVEIGNYLAEVYQGHVSAFYPAFPEGTLARVHFIIGRREGKTPRIASARLEQNVSEIVRTWDDKVNTLARAQNRSQLQSIIGSFTDDYRTAFQPQQGLDDAEHLAKLSETRPIVIDFYRSEDAQAHHAGLKIYHYGKPVSLSRRVPLLENMGFKVISERTYDIERANTPPLYIHDMELKNPLLTDIDLSDGGTLFAEVFMSVWTGAADNDRYNGLVQTARLPSSSIAILRAYGRYLQQAGITYSQDFIADVLNRYHEVASRLFDVFDARFNPKLKRSEAAKSADKAKSDILNSLQSVPSLDDDNVLRRCLNLIEATLRTNKYALDGETPWPLAFKLEPQKINGLPEPRPWREIFVYGADVEGVHCRFGPVARGGLRWSDRGQDYRTEVLGLVKAQQVKNSVIVPVGAKGGFFPKKLPAGGSRQEVFEAGRAAYITFVSTLISLADNLDGDKIIPPKNVVRHDNDDPYFVVAADKGTATFSDTANGISQEHDFWLDDAFASGGSAGYDHKKMGITARGGWEAVKRHFREMNIDIQTTPFEVVGVGDMSGDVFGNGMLLSKKIRLIAAFDHRDIFIDPDPDPATSFKERQRLFDMGRSTWRDYDEKKISKGGGVFSRSEKSITLSKTAATAIGLEKVTATPFEIMTAILKAKVDLLWFGGIGTYIRESGESNADAGDRANDPIRITAKEVGAKVIGEGANLGVTQRARIEYCAHGGRCNSDAIDNAGGVNSSDVEVNIKIALASAMRSGKLKRPARDKLLEAMTDEVADLVLASNYQQTLCISQTQRRGLLDHAYQARFMSDLESRGLLDRAVETLPDDATMSERALREAPLTRPELAVLVSYAKIVLFDELVNSDLPDDPHLAGDLLAYFPKRMAKTYDGEIRAHRLRREIIATEIANDIINRGGPTIISRLQDLTGIQSHAVVRAYLAVRDGFELPAVYAEIDKLDNKIDGQLQLQLYAGIGQFIHSRTTWYVRNGGLGTGDLTKDIASIQAARKALEPKLLSMMPKAGVDDYERRRKDFSDAGTPAALARNLAMLRPSALIADIKMIAESCKHDLPTAAKAFFQVTDMFDIGQLEAAKRSIAATDYYDGLALARAGDLIGKARRSICIAALSAKGKEKSPVDAWIAENQSGIDRIKQRIDSLLEGGELSVARLSVAAGILNDLAVG